MTSGIRRCDRPPPLSSSLDKRGTPMIRSVARFRLVGVVLLAPVVAVVAARAGQGTTSAGRPTITTAADFQRALKDVSNWGRWGKDDELGSSNLITPAKRKQAAALVKEGVTVSLAHD